MAGMPWVYSNFWRDFGPDLENSLHLQPHCCEQDKPEASKGLDTHLGNWSVPVG